MHLFQSFKTNKLLHRHMQQFHKLSPPKLDCPYVGCPHSFYKASELDRHYATHTGEQSARDRGTPLIGCDCEGR